MEENGLRKGGGHDEKGRIQHDAVESATRFTHQALAQALAWSQQGKKKLTVEVNDERRADLESCDHL